MKQTTLPGHKPKIKSGPNRALVSGRVFEGQCECGFTWQAQTYNRARQVHRLHLRGLVSVANKPDRST